MPQNPRIDERWIRHDWRLWIRPDIARWMKPGVDPADVIPALARERAQKQAARERARAAEDAEFDAFIARERRWLAAMREELNEIKAELARRRLEESKYSPSQPRVPRGNSRGGQWTDGGTGGSIAKPMGSVGVGDPSGSSELTGAPDDASADGEQIAGERQSGYPVDLHEERELGGHAIEGHVNRSDEALLSRARRIALSAEKDGSGDGFRVGSFSSLEAANKLVNSTLAQNQDKIDKVVSGQSSRETLEAEYPTITGREAYVRNARSQALMRDTNGVAVIIVPDGRVKKGYRVHTAFPRNFDR